VIWRAFPLHPETPEEGRTLEALFHGRMIDIQAMMRRLRQVAAEEKLPFGERTMTFNSRGAQELSKWAEAEGRGEAFHRAVFHAYFAEGRNIARWEVLSEICRSVGLDEASAAAVLEKRTYAEAVDRDGYRSHKLGIRAVPALLYRNRLLVGAQPFEKMAAFINAPAAAW